MSIYTEVATRSIDLTTLDGTTVKGPTAAIYTGSGGTIVCVLSSDPDGQDTTLESVPGGIILPISIKEWVSGPIDAVGLAV